MLFSYVAALLFRPSAGRAVSYSAIRASILATRYHRKSAKQARVPIVANTYSNILFKEKVYSVYSIITGVVTQIPNPVSENPGICAGFSQPRENARRNAYLTFHRCFFLQQKFGLGTALLPGPWETLNGIFSKNCSIF